MKQTVIDLGEHGAQHRIVVTPCRKEKAKVRYTPGARKRVSGSWSFPPNPRILEYLCTILNGVEVTPKAAQWYSSQVTREVALVALKGQTDAVVQHANAHRLWPFQRVGVAFISAAHRVLVADACGLGKTAMAVVAVETSQRDARVLVVCPNSLKRWWYDEIHAWTQRDDLQVTIVPNGRHRRDKAIADYKGGWLITHWEALRLLPQLARQGWNWLVLDEAHRVKNRKTQIFGALSEIPSARALALTGTPFSNDVSELWAPLHILRPYLYTSFWQFYEMYVLYIETYFGRKVVGARNDELLRSELAPIMLRRTKEEVLPDLPPKRYRTIRLGLHPAQAKAYRQMAREALVVLGNETIEAPNVVAQLVRLRQLSCSLGILGEEDKSTKLDALISLVKDAPDEKFVVFTTFIPMLDLIEARLKAADVKYESIRGGLGAERVSAAVKRFQSTTPEQCQVFCGTVQTGGVGLTLTASSQLIFVDKHWNPGVQQQAEDRIHRIGQHRGVVITSLHCTGTVDKTIQRVLNRKEKVSMRILAQEASFDLQYYLRRRLNGYGDDAGGSQGLRERASQEGQSEETGKQAEAPSANP